MKDHLSLASKTPLELNNLLVLQSPFCQAVHGPADVVKILASFSFYL